MLDLSPPPSRLLLTPVFELRERLERRVDRDFDRSVSDNRTDLFGRYRAGLSYRINGFSGQLVYQYAHDLIRTNARNFSDDRSDLLLGYVQRKVGPGVASIGRQKLRIGEERLIGAGEWGYVSNAYDIVRYTGKTFDVFAGKEGLMTANSQDVRLVGGTYTSPYGLTFGSFKHDDRNKVQSNEFTLDHAVRHGWGRLGGYLELAGQLGSRGGRRVEAWAGYGRLAYGVTSKLNVQLEGAAASGGGHGGMTRTFDQLFPAPHDKHGLLDVVGWQNMQRVGLQAVYSPTKRTDLKVEYHRFGLYSGTDGWYAGSGGLNRFAGGAYRDSSGKSGRDLGQEFDFDSVFRLDRHSSVRAGGGVFLPGRFVRKFESDAKNQLFGYVQYEFRF